MRNSLAGASAARPAQRAVIRGPTAVSVFDVAGRCIGLVCGSAAASGQRRVRLFCLLLLAASLSRAAWAQAAVASGASADLAARFTREMKDAAVGMPQRIEVRTEEEVRWTVEGAPETGEQLVTSPVLLVTVLYSPDGRRVLSWRPESETATPPETQRRRGAAFGRRQAVLRNDSGTVVLEPYAAAPSQCSGLGLLDQSGMFVFGDSERDGWWFWLSVAQPRLKSEAPIRTWELGWKGVAYTLEMDPAAGARVGGVGCVIADQNGVEALRAKARVSEWTEYQGAVVPAAIESTSVMRLAGAPGAAGPGGKNGIRVAKTQHRLVVTARSGVTPKELEDALERIVRLSAGEELHDFGAKFTAQGGSRVFEVAGEKYLAPEPIDSSETGPIEELVRRSKRLE